MIRRVRLENGTECDVLEVGIGQMSAGSCGLPEFFALVRMDDGQMYTRTLTRAVEIERKSPEPTTPTSSGEPRR